ncbi:GNAT family N-acetyltransferase [Streptomyces griseus]|uniref:GNAT family N-acetyltransferase n=1 Tax=Streptomyces griseus TaxID=1911 RepID=UPI0004C7F30B|nr:GNAT family N-acetyltransferase [Streptomyces griseus]
MAVLTLRPVRTAAPADDDQLAELDRSTWSTLHAVLPKPVPPFDPFFGERYPPQDFLVVEADPGTEGGAPRIAGYIRLVPPTPLAANAHVRQIRGLAVATWARGAGVGRTLVRAACAEARRRGANRITLRVLAHNDPARALYASEGFAVEGVLPGEFFLNGRYVDDVCMGRSLGPA